MSTKKQNIELSPAYICFGSIHEDFTVSGFDCNYCSGRGKFIKEGNYEDGYIDEECPVCRGEGKLKAVVSIAWKPDK